MSDLQYLTQEVQIQGPTPLLLLIDLTGMTTYKKDSQDLLDMHQTTGETHYK